MIIADIAIDAGYILSLDDLNTYFKDGTILIKGTDLCYVGDRLSKSEYTADKYIDATKSAVLPPFFNQHTHPSLSVYRGIGVDLALNDWLENAMWPLEKRFSNPENVYLGTMLSLIEMIHGGTGAATNMDYHNLAVGNAYKEAGLRALLGEAIFSTETPSCKTPEETFDYNRALVKQFEESDLINIILSVHAPYTSTSELYKKTAQLAQELGLMTTSHVAESMREVEWAKREFGISPVELVESSGIFSTRFVLIHGVHLNENDISILQTNNIPVIHNPHSNMVLGSGVCQVPKLLQEGIVVGLGTDSAASNNSLSMMAEMQTMARIHKVFSGNASNLPATSALRMATRTGYEIYQIPKCGQLKTGYKADLQTISMNNFNNVPDPDPFSNLVYSSFSGDTRDLIVDGKLIMENGVIQTIDEEMILKECSKLSIEIQKFIETKNG